MKTVPSKPESPNSQTKLQHAATAAQGADKLAKAVREKAHLAKLKFKAAKKVFKQAKKAARQAAKKARQARKELKAWLEQVASERKVKPASTHRRAPAGKKAVAPKTVRKSKLKARPVKKKVQVPAVISTPIQPDVVTLPQEPPVSPFS